MKLKSLRPSRKKGKKWDAVFDVNGRKKVVAFGAKGYTDYTKSKDPVRKARYLKRHSKREQWSKPDTPGALSRWILWNKPTIKASVADFKRKFNT
jgi:hypothetical protein